MTGNDEKKDFREIENEFIDCPEGLTGRPREKGKVVSEADIRSLSFIIGAAQVVFNQAKRDHQDLTGIFEDRLVPDTEVSPEEHLETVIRLRDALRWEAHDGPYRDQRKRIQNAERVLKTMSSAQKGGIGHAEELTAQMSGRGRKTGERSVKDALANIKKKEPGFDPFVPKKG